MRVKIGSSGIEEKKKLKEYVARQVAAGIPRKTAERNYKEHRRAQFERFEREQRNKDQT